MRDGEPGSFSVVEPARKARSILSTALELLQRNAAHEAQAVVLGHTARAVSALYRAEAEARTSEAAIQGIHVAAESLGQALTAFGELRTQRAECEAAASRIAQALALLYPIARATQRPRREVQFAIERENRALKVIANAEPALDAPEPDTREPPQERRSSQRRARIEVDIGLFSDSHFYAGLLLDLSSGGLFVGTAQAFQIGATLTLHFALPGGSSIEADATVRWKRGPESGASQGIGVQFSHLSAADLLAIQEFCERRPPLYFETDAV